MLGHRFTLNPRNMTHTYTLLDDRATIRYRDADFPLEDDAWATQQAHDAPDAGTVVVIGAGRGVLLEQLGALPGLTVILVDAEEQLDTARVAPLPDATVRIAENDPQTVTATLDRLLAEQAERPVHVIANPTYLRINPRLYAAVARSLSGRRKPTASPRGRRPKLLVLRFGYFLEREICAALSMIDADYAVFRPKGEAASGGGAFMTALGESIAAAKPDALLSINSLGGGAALDAVLERLGLPFATWFVDSPELFLHGKGITPSPRFVPFTCDPDGEAKLARLGCPGAHYLPLACDAARFDPGAELPPEAVTFDASFVGTTWVDKLGQAHCNFRHAAPILRGFRTVAADLAASRPHGPLEALFAARHPDFHAAFRALPPGEQNGALHLVCWEGNRRYRLERVRALLPAAPLIAGDAHWERLLGQGAKHATLHPPIAYYGADLPRLYAGSAVNLTCGGVQMPRAANQRHFDVPAAGGFLLTDRCDQAESCFEPGKEAVFYDSPEEIGPLTARYAKDRGAASAIIRAARKRIAAEHTYAHRMATLLDVLAQGAGS